MADITITPRGQFGYLNWGPQGGTMSDISVTLIGQSLDITNAPATALAFIWGVNPAGRSLSLAQGTVTVVTIQNVSINGQALSLNIGTPLIYDYRATQQSLSLAQGTLTLLADVSLTPTGQLAHLNQSPNIAADTDYTTVGQALSLARGTPTTSVAAETIVSLVGQALTLGRSNPSIASTVIIINPASQLAHLTQSPNVYEERLVLLLGQQLNLSQGVPTVNIVNNTAAATNVSILGQALLLDRGVPVGVVASFIPVGRQLTLSIPTIVSRVDRSEQIDGQTLSLAQGTPTVVSIPGVTNIVGQVLVLNRGIPVVTVATINSITGQALTLSQGSITVAITIDDSATIAGQQLTLNQGTIDLSFGADVEIFGSQLLFLQQGSILVQDALNVTEPISPQQLNLAQGSVNVIISEEALDVNIDGIDLILTQGSAHAVSSTVDEEIAQAGQQLILNQGSICISIYDIGEDSFDPAYIIEFPDDVEYVFGESLVSPTYIPEHCD